MAYTFLLRNTPAFAYCSSFEEPIFCKLYIKNSKSCREASIYLIFHIHVHGFKEAQPFQLTYGGDKWKAMGVSSAKRDLDEHQLATIMKNTSPAPTTLSLDLHQPCTVQCRPSSGCFAEKLGHEFEFDKLRQLASAIKVDIVFDFRRLYDQNQAAFTQLIIYSANITGVAETYSGELSRQTDWTVFSPLEDDVPSDPPLYTAPSAEPSTPGTGSLSPTQPPSKRRRILSPGPYRALLQTAPSFVAGSPTEKATTASPSSPPSPLHHTSELEQIVKTIVEAVLPSALDQLFSTDVSTSDSTATPSIATRISTHIAADAGERLQKVCVRKLNKLRTDTLNDALDTRATADNEFLEQLDDYKADLALAKEEGIAELRDTVEEITKTAEAIRDKTDAEMREYAEELCLEACGRLYNALVTEEGRCMQCIRRMRWVPGQDAHPRRGGRAASLPL